MMNKVTSEELENLRELHRKATPGPWEMVVDGIVTSQNACGEEYYCDLICREADEDYILAACNAIPALVEEVEQLRAALQLAYRVLTDGMADVLAGERYRKCAEMRVEAKRVIRQVLGMEVR